MNAKSLLSLLLSSALAGGVAFAQSAVHSNVPSANQRAGHPDNIVAKGFSLVQIVQGSDPLENPSGVITNFGLLNDSPPQTVERTRTEPDENTYLIFKDGLPGPTSGFDYGTHFLFQGHENANDLAYITRVNLDVNDPAHRITLLTPVGDNGKTGFNSIDGSTWNPFTQTLLFTQETGSPRGGVIEVTPGWPPVVRRLDGILGSAGYEGIHPTRAGNLIFCEDAGGTTVNVVQGDTTSPLGARQPNSFVYMFVPNNKSDLSEGGMLLAMQVLIDRQPVTFHASDAVGDVFSDAQLKLHTPGSAWPFRWVVVHDTSVDGTASFNANAAAKAAGATPFKRPENLAFLPGSDFRTFFFDPTGDTSAASGNQPALAARGAWGSIFKVTMSGPGVDGGLISIFFRGDSVHAAFDNLAMADENTLLAAEDRGDGLHRSLNTLDSIWAFNIHQPDTPPRRFIALGRDEESEADAGFLDAGTPGFQNDGDNEPTGLFVSEGGTTIQRLLGKTPPRREQARWFFTQQHGKNRIFQIIRSDD
ncbi:MAG TPA: phosphatase [Blastocatellia bacterium]|nr:phosphatase [Blastocatellia bacterium]